MTRPAKSVIALNGTAPERGVGHSSPDIPPDVPPGYCYVWGVGRKVEKNWEKVEYSYEYIFFVFNQQLVIIINEEMKRNTYIAYGP